MLIGCGNERGFCAPAWRSALTLSLLVSPAIPQTHRDYVTGAVTGTKSEPGALDFRGPVFRRKAGNIDMMKTRMMTVVLFLATMQFIALGLLFLLRLHYRFFGISFLVLGALTLFIAERYRRRGATKEPPKSHENSPAGTAG